MKYVNILLIGLVLLFPGCTFLDVVPEGNIESIESNFEKRDQTENWFKYCHFWVSPFTTSVISNPAYMGTDEVVAGTYLRESGFNWSGLYIADGLQRTFDPYCNMWRRDAVYNSIRYCNTFLEKVWGVYNMTDAEKKLWVAEIKALKAYYYFELLRHYGPFVVMDENIDPGVPVEDMKKERSPVDVCVEEIVSLLDEAMKDLPLMKDKERSRWAYHSLESAAALKAMTLFYAASPLFNGNPAYSGFVNSKGEKLFSQQKDPEKWRYAAEAVDSALLICNRGGKYLISSESDKITDRIKDIEASAIALNFENAEAIYMFRYESFVNGGWPKWTRPYFNSMDEDYNMEMKGCVAPSLKMVEMYYTEHGLPIEEDKAWWKYEERYTMGTEDDKRYKDVVAMDEKVLKLHLKREPRFYAHIAADRCYYQLGKKKVLVEAYRGERFGTREASITNSVPQNLTGYWMKKGSDSEVSNVGYNNAFTNDYPCVLIRLADLYLMKAEAWNEYLAVPDEEHVYAPLNEVRRRAGIPDVKEAWETYAKNPGKVATKEGMREIIHREWDIEFAFEGRRFWNLRRWLTAVDELNEEQYGWNIVGQNAREFYNNFREPVMVWAKRKFISPRDYLFPLQSEEVMISGCVQNPGW